MGIATGVAGLVGGLAGMFGGNSMPQAPQGFQMPNMSSAAGNLFSGIQGLQPFANLGQNSLGYGQNVFNTLQNNPYSGGLQGGANLAGGLGQGQALNQFNTGGALTGLGFNTGAAVSGIGGNIAGLGAQVPGLANPLIAGAGNVLNTAFDPQSQLYNYLQNQNLQQTQAINAGAGLATTPYGAGVEALANQQFNMNWQNQQLGRQESGLGAAQGALGQAGQLYNTGGSLQSLGAGLMGAGAGLTGQLAGQGTAMQAGAPGQYLQASGWPYGTFNQIGNDQYANINNLLGVGSGGLNLANAQNQGWQNYLQTGNQSNQVANQLYGLQLQAQQQQFNQNMAYGQAIGGGLYNMGRGMSGGLTSPFLGPMFSSGGGGTVGYSGGTPGIVGPQAFGPGYSYY